MDVLFPDKLDALWKLWDSHPEARLMAGGTDLLVAVAAKRIRPRTLICLERIGELRQIRRGETEYHIGATATIQDILDDEGLGKEMPLLAHALSLLGSPPIRHAATLGGNICTASPAGDSLPPLHVMDASVELRSAQGNRRMPVSEFITAPGRSVLRQGEILDSVIVPLTCGGDCCGFFKLGHRKALAIAVASLAAVWRTDPNGVLTKIRLAWGSVGPTTMLLPDVEKWLLGKPLDEETLTHARRMARDGVAPIDDLRATASYRRESAGNLLFKLLDASPISPHVFS